MNFIRKLLRGRENIAAIISVLIGAAVVYYGSGLQSQYYQGVMANLGTGIVGLGIGVALVNVYFDYHSRKAAVRPLLLLVAPSIAEHHNDLLDDGFDTFGKASFSELLDRYTSNSGDPRALSPEERTKLYSMVKAKKPQHDAKLLKLDAELRELGTILGWGFDPSVLGASFVCRFAIAKFLATTCDDTDQTVKSICEHFLDVSLSAHRTFDGLINIIGAPKSEVYSSK